MSSVSENKTFHVKHSKFDHLVVLSSFEQVKNIMSEFEVIVIEATPAVRQLCAAARWSQDPFAHP